MALTEGEIERIAQLLFEKFLQHQKTVEKTENQYMVYDEFGNSSIVSEAEFYYYELERLYDLENKYVESEDYEKADIIKNKILKIKLKLSKLK